MIGQVGCLNYQYNVTPGVLTQTYTKVSKMIGRHVRLTLRVLSKRSIIDESNLAILIRFGFR